MSPVPPLVAPQHQRRCFAIAQVSVPPTATDEISLVAPTTRVGRERSLFPPSPSCIWSLAPQHQRPSSTVWAQVVPPSAHTFETGVTRLSEHATETDVSASDRLQLNHRGMGS